MNSTFHLPQNTAPPPILSTSVNHTITHPSVETRNVEFIHLFSAPNPTSNLYSSPKFLPLKCIPKLLTLFVCTTTILIQATLSSCLVHHNSFLSVSPFLILDLFQLILHFITRLTFLNEVIRSHFSA